MAIASGGKTLVPLKRLTSSMPISLGERQKRAIIFVTFAFATLFCITVPRIGPLVVVSITTAICVYLLFQDKPRTGYFENILFRPEMPFVFWAVIASLWSPSQSDAFLKAMFLLVLVLQAIILVKTFRLIDARDVEMAAYGLVVGVILAGIYVALEIDSRQAITRFILTHLPELDRSVEKHAKMRDGMIVGLSGAHNTRVSAILCLFVCPALLALQVYAKGFVKWIGWAVLAAILLVVFQHPRTHSQTSQMAIFVLAITLVLATLSVRLARWAVGAMAACAVLFVIPASMAMYTAGLHEEKSLFRSARARVVIWNGFAEETLQRPIVGAGTHSSKYFRPEPSIVHKMQYNEVGLGFSARRHPHNMYLQIWYELGIVGALTFALLGYSLWSRIRELPRKVAILVTGHFAVCTTIIAPSYGLWQNWFQAAFVVSIMTLIFVATPAIRDAINETGALPES